MQGLPTSVAVALAVSQLPLLASGCSPSLDELIAEDRLVEAQYATWGEEPAALTDALLSRFDPSVEVHVLGPDELAQLVGDVPDEFGREAFLLRVTVTAGRQAKSARWVCEGPTITNAVILAGGLELSMATAEHAKLRDLIAGIPLDPVEAARYREQKSDGPKVSSVFGLVGDLLVGTVTLGQLDLKLREAGAENQELTRVARAVHGSMADRPEEARRAPGRAVLKELVTRPRCHAMPGKPCDTYLLVARGNRCAGSELFVEVRLPLEATDEDGGLALYHLTLAVPLDPERGVREQINATFADGPWRLADHREQLTPRGLAYTCE